MKTCLNNFGFKSSTHVIQGQLHLFHNRKMKMLYYFTRLCIFILTFSKDSRGMDIILLKPKIFLWQNESQKPWTSDDSVVVSPYFEETPVLSN